MLGGLRDDEWEKTLDWFGGRCTYPDEVQVDSLDVVLHRRQVDDKLRRLQVLVRGTGRGKEVGHGLAPRSGRAGLDRVDAHRRRFSRIASRRCSRAVRGVRVSWRRRTFPNGSIQMT